MSGQINLARYINDISKDIYFFMSASGSASAPSLLSSVPVEIVSALGTAFTSLPINIGLYFGLLTVTLSCPVHSCKYQVLCLTSVWTGNVLYTDEPSR